LNPAPVLSEGLPDDVAHTALAIMSRVLDRCEPGRAVTDWLNVNELGAFRRIRVLAFGKASVPMARAAIERLDIRMSQAVVLAPPGLAGGLDHPDCSTHTVDHPIPTRRNVEAAGALAECAMAAPEDECVLVLASGGGSAHLTLPRAGITLEDVQRTTNALLRAGAPIEDLNAVRSAMDQLKGGGLRAICPADAVRVLLVSDVIGDDPGVIASGPLATPRPSDPLGVLRRWGVDVPAHVANVIATPKAVTDRPPAEHHVLLSGARLLPALRDDLHAPDGPGCSPIDAQPPPPPLTGEASEAGRRLAGRLASLAEPPAPGGPNGVLAWGETTVAVGSASGSGGRSMELALSAAHALPPGRGWAVLAFATDGTDGPTDAAGAVLCSEMFQDPRARELAASALTNHDSYHAVEKLGGLIRTGPTGTNVNDIAVLWWRRDGGFA
jgi:glycerate-2-kinase